MPVSLKDCSCTSGIRLVLMLCQSVFRFVNFLIHTLRFKNFSENTTAYSKDYW